MTLDRIATDPSLFPIRYDPAADAFGIARNDLATLGDAAFLDDRAAIGWSHASPVAASSPLLATLPAASPQWLFHTAFCGSTLLARALHAPPGAVALKEPQALLDLSHGSLREATLPRDRLVARLDTTIRLLGRPWTPGGRVLVKPTNQVNRLLPEILRLAPTSRAVLLYSSLEEFLLSCCKKLPEAETRIRWMAQHLLVGSRLPERLGIAPMQPFNFVESCVLTWYAQIERYADALRDDHGARLRTLDMRTMMRRREATVHACATWLQLDAALDDLPPRVAREFSRDAKSTARAFSPEQREAEKQALQAQYGPLVAQALAWANDAIAPHAIVPADWQPLAID